MGTRNIYCLNRYRNCSPRNAKIRRRKPQTKHNVEQFWSTAKLHRARTRCSVLRMGCVRQQSYRIEIDKERAKEGSIDSMHCFRRSPLAAQFVVKDFIGKVLFRCRPPSAVRRGKLFRLFSLFPHWLRLDSGRKTLHCRENVNPRETNICS